MGATVGDGRAAVEVNLEPLFRGVRRRRRRSTPGALHRRELAECIQPSKAIAAKRGLSLQGEPTLVAAESCPVPHLRQFPTNAC